ncbi:hypothetical protein WR25_19616 [Diploscapter pachys]|uniref:Uncharacterized protein n=1 Tax=Diploscapter pachys TaxID=2018661 RepID=A0A2A2JTH6_9BILA|nr:hypothetical protein WR25_19616 [Diploscapter pachys]
MIELYEGIQNYWFLYNELVYVISTNFQTDLENRWIKFAFNKVDAVINCMNLPENYNHVEYYPHLRLLLLEVMCLATSQTFSRERHYASRGLFSRILNRYDDKVLAMFDKLGYGLKEKTQNFEAPPGKLELVEDYVKSRVSQFKYC